MNFEFGKVVAIHQPNFFPWLGYFAKISSSDVFVFLDDVQFPKKGGVWTNRVKVLMSGDSRWATAAIDRDYEGTRTISQMRFLKSILWREKLLKSIEVNYRRHSHYSEAIEVISPLLLSQEDNIATYNMNVITMISECLGIDVSKFRRSSQLAHSGSSNELLCSITSCVGGTVYVCGGGADGYQDESIFKKNKIGLVHQNFVHPIYPQQGRLDFVAGLSIIDAAMNLGWQCVRELLDTSSR
jgi:hypothetical protein